MAALYPLLVVVSLAAAVLPMLVFLGLVWWFDRYDREPLWLLGLTFLWGALGATLLSLLGNTTAELGLTALVGAEQAGNLTPVLVAPLVEEPTKALVLFLVLLSRHFDNTTDGFVYGAAAGFGFGMTENFLYFWQVASLTSWDPVEGLRAWTETVAVRTFFSAVLHATASSLVGAALGWARFRSWTARLVVVPLGFLAAMGMHGLWNGLITMDAAGDHGGRLTRINMMILPAEAALIFLVFQVTLLVERRDIQAELEAEAREGTLPEAHARPIASITGRRFGRWLPPGVPRAPYVRAATTLAFRRRQARMLPHDPFYAEEVDRLRRELRGILAAAPR